jgi:alpha-beta hydrolase superfamily lysophospholipase
MFDNRMLVQATIDGKGPFSLIVDTGSSDLVVTSPIARKLGLALRSAGAATGAGSGSTPIYQTHVAGLAIGSLRFANAPASVIDLSPIARAFGFPRLDGIIGYTILRKYRMEVDMDDRRLTLSLPPLTVPKSASPVPFTAGNGQIHIQAAVDGVHGRFMVDTGDRFSLTLVRHFAEANGFYRDAPVRDAVTGIGVGGPVYGDVLRTTLSVFGATIPGVVTRASRDRGGAFAGGPDDASIGNGVLKRFNIVYDYPDAEIFAWPSRFFHDPDRFQPLVFEHGVFHAQGSNDPTLPASPAPSLPRHAVFGAGVAQAGNTVRATFIVPNSPAAIAGLRAGDTIRAIDGKPITTVGEFLLAVHDVRAGKRVGVEIVRNGETLRTDAVLAAAPDETDPSVTTQYGEIVVDDSLRRTLLTIPQGLASRAPAVLLLGGIGCYTVDAASNAQDAYLRLTHDLAKAGFISMRIEKSGVGDSQGPPCRNVDFEAEVRGYTAALASLQRNSRVDPARIYLLGHSIGTVIAPRLALGTNVAGVIVLEAVGRDWPEYEIRNLRRDLELDGESPAAVDLALLEKAECMQQLLFQYQPEDAIERSMPSCRAHDAIYPAPAAYMQQVAHLNIIEPWTKLNVPVLAVYGLADFETELADHQRIVAVVNAAHAGTATLVIINGMSHGLGHAATPKDALADDNRGTVETFDGDVSAAIVAWLKATRP